MSGAVCPEPPRPPFPPLAPNRHRSVGRSRPVTGLDPGIQILVPQ